MLNDVEYNDKSVNLAEQNDIMIPPFASENGDSFNNNFILINYADRYALCNQASYFSYSSEQLQSGNVTNIPPSVDKTQYFIGYREVFPKAVSPQGYAHVIVKLTEFYPNLGKEHWIFFNNGSWNMWEDGNGNIEK